MDPVGSLTPNLASLIRSYPKEIHSEITVDKAVFLLAERAIEYDTLPFSNNELDGIIRRSKHHDHFIFTMNLKRIVELSRSRDIEEVSM